MSGGLLLEWMTHLGSGTWGAFRNAVDELYGNSGEGDEHAQYRQLRVALSDLGHADFFVDGSRRWQVRRPALVGLAGSETRHMLTGGRTSELAGRVADAAAAVGVSVRTGVVLGLPQTYLDGESFLLTQIAAELGLEYLRNASAVLAAQLPRLRDTYCAAREASEPVNWSVRSWCFRMADWVPERRDRTVREYTNRYGIRRYLVGGGRHRPLREVEKRSAIYCAAMLQNQRIASYSYDTRELHVPVWAPPPEQHARAACLAGGTLPLVEAGNFVFANVDPRIAAALLVSLGQGFPLPEASP